MPVTKVYEGRYIEPEKLKALLTSLFGADWNASSSMGRWIISAPRALTQVCLRSFSFFFFAPSKVLSCRQSTIHVQSRSCLTHVLTSHCNWLGFYCGAEPKRFWGWLRRLMLSMRNDYRSDSPVLDRPLTGHSSHILHM
ncbi:hypothetical protein K469DRAFT_738864 [Zopfia rhizophila CBS 207.26]|uniref:Uncharacterized protein n=1 Tax=Zopfia rhizophila CBS 207.26 TaxID=1314779 RepID=A0A6A6E4H4_9PEZI|nr:hypothetical protein K469DRAFT_738864 [Zopfia rhizophila CBS 207.26]